MRRARAAVLVGRGGPSPGAARRARARRPAGSGHGARGPGETALERSTAVGAPPRGASGAALGGRARGGGTRRHPGVGDPRHPICAPRAAGRARSAPARACPAAGAHVARLAHRHQRGQPEGDRRHRPCRRMDRLEPRPKAGLPRHSPSAGAALGEAVPALGDRGPAAEIGRRLRRRRRRPRCARGHRRRRTSGPLRGHRGIPRRRPRSHRTNRDARRGQPG